MPFPKYLARPLLGLVCLSVSLLSAQAMALADPEKKLLDPAQMAHKLDDASCLSCHENRQAVIQVPDEEDDEEKRALRAVDLRSYQKGVHGDMTCIECHQNIVDVQLPHN